MNSYNTCSTYKHENDNQSTDDNHAMAQSDEKILCNITKEKGETKFILYNSSNTYYVTKEIFIHYLNYKRNLKNKQIMSFILDPKKYISHEIKFINKNITDFSYGNIDVIYNYGNNYKLDIGIDIDNHNEYYGIIYLQEQQTPLYIDIDILLDFKNKAHSFKYEQKISEYPYYVYNYHNIDLLEHIIGLRRLNLDIEFINKNNNDLRRKNLQYKHKYHKIMIQKYPNAEYIQGHYKNNGQDAYIIKNPMWKINGIYHILCEGDNENIVIVDEKAYFNLSKYEESNNAKLTYHISANGYCLCNPHKLYIHQIITGCYGNGKGTKNISVDHIDQNPLNNCYSNLRLADRKTQEQNCNGIKKDTKRARKYNARSLPEGITQDMLPKYVVYYKECYNKEKQLYREFFTLEKNPKLEKPISSSKSSKKTIFQKLKEIKDIANKVENNTYEKNENSQNNIKMPTGFSICIFRNAEHFVYDIKKDNKRYNLKMKINKNENISNEFEKFKVKLKHKYADLVF